MVAPVVIERIFREVMLAQRREKSCVLIRRPYRKPTQVDGCKGTKASERRVVKELGKLTP